MPFHPKTPVTVALLLLLPLLAGCSGARLFSLPWQKDKIVTADAKNPVHRIVCMWEPSEGRRPDGMPARGFAGQILFFTRTSSTPVRVEGDVKIYVFDDQGPNGNPTLPISEFDFVKSSEGDAWNRHLTVTTLGPSYNVFVPYMRRGGHQARCALQVRLVANGDAPIFSDVATIVLPGPSVQTEDPSLLPTSQPAPSRTLSHFVDGPFGRQPVGQPGTQSGSQLETPAIGAFVRSPKGVSVTTARQTPFPTPGGAPASPASNPALASDAASGNTPGDADRLARIEQMIEQLAAQQRASVEMRPDAAVVNRYGVQPASGTGSFLPPETMQGAAGRGGVTPAAFEQPPTTSDVTHSRSGADFSATSTRPAEPGRLDDMRLDHTPRRLQPRASWFDDSSRSSAHSTDSSHPLRSSATSSWPDRY